MKHVWWLIVAAVTAAIVLTYLLSRTRAEAAPAAEPPGIIAFYPRAAARAAKPPAEKSLKLLADWKEANGDHIAFVSTGRKSALLAVMTREKFKKPDQAIFLSPRYVVAKDMKAVQEGREPLVHATAGEVTDWGYVYDRNGDGRADYVAYLVGPMPIEPDSMPADFPMAEGALSSAQLDYLLDHSRYVFHHAADENFDGTVDALVLYVRDSDRAWVKSFAAVLAPGGGAPDSAWTFRDAIASPTGALARANGGFLRHRVAGTDVVVTSANFRDWTGILGRINAAAESTKTVFVKAP